MPLAEPFQLTSNDCLERGHIIFRLLDLVWSVICQMLRMDFNCTVTYHRSVAPLRLLQAAKCEFSLRDVGGKGKSRLTHLSLIQ